MLLYIFVLVLVANGAVVERKSRNIEEDPIDYLTEYGYLSRSNQETGELRSAEEIENAVKNFQKMAGLPQTGKVDDPRLKEIMGKPRCGIGDSRVNKDPNAPSSYQVSNSKWDNKVVTFKIISYSPDYNREAQRRDIHNAFNIWRDVSDLQFNEVHRDSKADIIISFGRYNHGDGYPFDGRGGTLAHAFTPGPERGGDAHFDDDETWSESGSESGTTSLFIVAAHEFGHSLGIYHSDQREALMYPWYQYSPKLTLSYDDIMAIQSLYGPPDPSKTLPPGNTPVIVTSLPSTTTSHPTPSPRPVPTQKPGSNDPPNPCNTDIDAVASVRREVFAFKGKWFWRFNRNGYLMEDKPEKTSYFWDVLPDLEKIDAVTFIESIDWIVFFSGDRYWILQGRSLAGGTPKQGFPLTRLGLGSNVKKIDAALTWGHNKRTYLFRGYEYWRLEDSAHDLRVESGYPKTFDIWDQIPVPVDASFTHADGSTYFFKGTQFYKFDDKTMTADPRYPQDIGQMWLNCGYNLGYSSSSFLRSGVAPLLSSIVFVAIIVAI